MARPKFAPKVPLPVDRSANPTIPASSLDPSDLWCQTASGSDPPFFHNTLDRPTHRPTDRRQESLSTIAAALRERRGLKIIIIIMGQITNRGTKIMVYCIDGVRLYREFGVLGPLIVFAFMYRSETTKDMWCWRCFVWLVELYLNMSVSSDGLHFICQSSTSWRERSQIGCPVIKMLGTSINFPDQTVKCRYANVQQNIRATKYTK